MSDLYIINNIISDNIAPHRLTAVNSLWLISQRRGVVLVV
jgi:hypothetical protein